MGRSQKKRLLAASERFRRNYFYYFYTQHTDKNGVTHIPMHIESRILNHKRVWK
jgi:hypothetical protein